jgi:hypothetical protein
MNKVDSYIIINKIKLTRKVLEFGLDKVVEYADSDELEWLNTLKDKTNDELKLTLTELKTELNNNSVRTKKEGLKFCIRKCQREFIPKDGNLEVYCPSCDRTIAVRPIKNDFKDV